MNVLLLPAISLAKDLFQRVLPLHETPSPSSLQSVKAGFQLPSAPTAQPLGHSFNAFLATHHIQTVKEAEEAAQQLSQAIKHHPNLNANSHGDVLEIAFTHGNLIARTSDGHEKILATDSPEGQLALNFHHLKSTLRLTQYGFSLQEAAKRITQAPSERVTWSL